MEVTAPILHNHTRISHHHHDRAWPRGARTSATKPPRFLTDLTSLTAHHRLKYSLETQITQSITLSCKMASSPKHNLLLHPIPTWELRTFSGTHSSSPLVWHLNRERKVICQPADWVKEHEVRTLLVCSQSQKERSQKQPHPNTGDRNRERKTHNKNRWCWVGPS